LHCASLLHTIFTSLARAHERMCIQNIRDFPQTKLDNEINAPFLLNEHGDPHFFFHNFNGNNILNSWEKKLEEIYGYYFGKWNKYYRGRQNGPNRAHVQIMFAIRDKKNAGYMNTFFLGHRWINNQRKSNSVWYNMLHWKIIELICCTRRLPKVT